MVLVFTYPLAPPWRSRFLYNRCFPIIIKMQPHIIISPPSFMTHSGTPQRHTRALTGHLHPRWNKLNYCPFYLKWWKIVTGAGPSLLITVDLLLCEDSPTVNRILAPNVNQALVIVRSIVGFKTTGLTTDDLFGLETGNGAETNNWLNRQIVLCMVCAGPRPILCVTLSVFRYNSMGCASDLISQHNPSSDCTVFDSYFPVTAQMSLLLFLMLSYLRISCYTRQPESNPREFVGHI